MTAIGTRNLHAELIGSSRSGNASAVPLQSYFYLYLKLKLDNRIISIDIKLLQIITSVIKLDLFAFCRVRHHDSVTKLDNCYYIIFRARKSK